MTPNIYLIGFMGTGKSAIGRQLAQELDAPFMDSDHVIEASEKRAIKDIFATDGEAHFRQLEKNFVEEGHPQEGCVISCGGGLPIQPGMLELLKERGLVVSLFASVDTILQRTSSNEERPLLNVKNPRKRIEAMLAEREPVYLKADCWITTDKRSIAEIVEHIQRFLKDRPKRQA